MMEIVNEIKENEIIINIKSNGVYLPERFPNKLIWDINSLLDSEYDLYEYYLSKYKDGDYCIKLPSILPIPQKYLCFRKLHETYIRLIDYDEQEYREEYLKHRDELDSIDFDKFCDYYSMEWIAELNYIAVKDIQNILKKVKRDLRGNYINRNRYITNILKNIPIVYVCITDHDYLSIYTSDSIILTKIYNLLSKYF